MAETWSRNLPASRQQKTVEQEGEQQARYQQSNSPEEGEETSESEQCFRAVWNCASDAMALSRADGTVFAVNPAYSQLFGYRPEDILGQNFSLIFPPDLRQWAQEQYLALFQQEEITPPSESLVVRADGTQRMVEARYNFLTQHGRRTAMLSIIRDITERKALDQRKDAFISMASHELKNPITALQGMTQLLKRRLDLQGLDEPTVLLSKMERQIKSLTRLINELLDVSKIQAGKVEYAYEDVVLDVVVREAAETLHQIHPTHGIAVHGASNIHILGDHERLGQVFTNLMSNAINYSPPDGAIDVAMTTSQDRVRVHVRDYGVGISKQDQSKIFDRFYRVSNRQQKKVSGLGMGLFIAAEIIKRHGGEITVESEEGKGATFCVDLPLQGEEEQPVRQGAN
jgi:PAS domain S-box-containing protein